MTNRNPWRFGTTCALTAAISYAVCTLVWIAFTEPSIQFLNALFHGLDFGRLQVGGEFSAAAWAAAMAVLVVWAFLAGSLFAWLRNRLPDEPRRLKPAGAPAVGK